jgi:hypothetical protein
MAQGKKLKRIFDLHGNLVTGQPTQELLVNAVSRGFTSHPSVHARKRDGSGGWWEYVPDHDVQALRDRGVDVREVVLR